MKRVLILLSLYASSLLANIGEVTALRGTASLIHNGSTKDVKVGTILEVHDELKTDPKSKLQIVFKDKTVISLGQKSHFKIDEYLFEDKKVAAKFEIKKGFFKSITGRIGKIAPKRFKIKTANATIGVRGTTIIGEVTPKRDIIACSSGQIVVSNSVGSMVVGAGERTIVSSMKMPKEAKKVNSVILNQLDSKSNIDDENIPDTSTSTTTKENANKKDINLVEEKTSEKFEPWLETVGDYIPTIYEKDIGTKTPSYSGHIVGGKITEGTSSRSIDRDSSSVNLKFNLGNGNVNGRFKFQDPADKSDYDIAVNGKMRSNGSFKLSDTTSGYQGSASGKLSGDKFKNANGDFKFSEKDVSGKLYKSIDGKFETSR